MTPGAVRKVAEEVFCAERLSLVTVGAFSAAEERAVSAVAESFPVEFGTKLSGSSPVGRSEHGPMSATG